MQLLIQWLLVHVREDNKNLSLNITLVWAIHANDCLHINYAYQLANWI